MDNNYDYKPEGIREYTGIVTKKESEYIEIISNQLKTMRENSHDRNGKKFSQRKIASLADISKSTYSAYEKGQSLPSMQNIIRLSIIYNCDICALLGASGTNRDYGFICDKTGLSQKAIEKIQNEYIFWNKVKDHMRNRTGMSLSWLLENGLMTVLESLNSLDYFSNNIVSVYQQLPQELCQRIESISCEFVPDTSFDNKLIRTIVKTFIDKTVPIRALYKAQKVISSKRDLLDKEFKSTTLNLERINIITETKKELDFDKRSPDYDTNRIEKLGHDITQICPYLYLVCMITIKQQQFKEQTLFNCSLKVNELIHKYCDEFAPGFKNR